MSNARPFVPWLDKPMRISMAGDDVSLHFDLSDLTPKQQEDHLSNQVLTAMLQVALLYLCKEGSDEACLYDTFDSEEWRPFLNAYQAMFKKLGLGPTENISFHPFDDYYASVAQQTSEHLQNLYMISGSNAGIHQDEAFLSVSQNLNSKVHFANNAPGFGIPTPATLLTTKESLDNDLPAFAEMHGFPIMLKLLGLAGARNVTAVSSLEEAKAYVAEYEQDMAIILQQRLDPAAFKEMTVDLAVSDDEVAISNVRQIMFADGLWVGNLLGPQVNLTESQEHKLLRLGEYAREHGYSNKHAINLGVDFFVNENSPDPQDLYVTEINARWTGGLFPAELVRRLNVTDQTVIAFIDLCPPNRLNDLTRFLERHLYTEDYVGFATAPMGFAPYPTNIEGVDYHFVWQIVIGDFEAFKRARLEELGDDVLVTTPRISLEL